MKLFSPFRILDALAKFEFDFVAEKWIKTSKDENNYCAPWKLAQEYDKIWNADRE